MVRVLGKELNVRQQLLLGLLLVLSVSLICFVLRSYLEYRLVALLLLLCVSIAAVCFEIIPVLVIAALSAFVWNFFFIPPLFTLQIHTPSDAIFLLMYFIIAMVNAVLSFKIRQIEKAFRLKEDRANAIKLYNAFLNSLSHELRTPIAAILGATDNLQEKNVNLTEGDKDQLIAEISKASLRLNQQVENLLNMSRLESGFLKPRRDWCDVSELAHEVVKSLDDHTVLHPVQIYQEPDLPLYRLDKGMLDQILYNLLFNACVHTPAGSNIMLSLEARKEGLRIVVEDEGPGFPEEEIPFVFDKFYRLKDVPVQGTGLGLSIVKGFTEALDGSIQLQNIPSGGARFTLQLPAENSYLKV
jgi:two-component system sensor histidine kinase KdpD